MALLCVGEYGTACESGIDARCPEYRRVNLKGQPLRMGSREDKMYLVVSADAAKSHCASLMSLHGQILLSWASSLVWLKPAAHNCLIGGSNPSWPTS